MDFYELLGVKRNATQDEIKAAFRFLSKKAHPDMGGDEMAYKALSLAYDVLKDPVKRARYDETGDYHAEPTEDERRYERICLFLRNTLNEVILGGGHNYGPYDDMQKLCLEVMDAKLKEIDGIIAQHRVQEKKLRRVVKRFRRKSPDQRNIVQILIMQKLEEIRMQLRLIRSDRVTVEMSREIMADYEFLVAKAKPDAPKLAGPKAPKVVVRGASAADAALIDQLFAQAFLELGRGR